MEKPVLLAPQEHQDFLVTKDPKEHLAQEVQQETLVLMEHKDQKDKLVTKDQLDPVVRLVLKVRKAKKDSLDQQA